MRLLLAVSVLLLFVSGSPAGRKPIIVLISIDTLRADHPGAYGYSQPTSPFLDSLAESGVLFEEAIVPLPATGPSHASMLTSVRPWKHGLATNGLVLHGKIDTLAAAMTRAAYYTIGAVAVDHLGVGQRFGRGFASFTQPRRFSGSAQQARHDFHRRLGISDRRVLVHTGSVGTWYMGDATVEFFATMLASDPSAFFLILTQTPRENIEGKLRSRGVPESTYMIREVPPGDVPDCLHAADVAISFIRACYSKQSSSPTKIAEYLAAGLPLVCNTGVGDLDSLVENERVGVLVDESSAAEYAKALRELETLAADPALASRCRATAVNFFDLNRIGGEKYRRLYRHLAPSAP